MFTKIIAALDNSPTSRTVFAEALALAKLAGAHLRLVHVLTLEDDGFPEAPVPPPEDLYTFIGEAAFERYLELRETLQKKSSERLQRLVDEARATGVEASFVQHLGLPEHAIGKLAREWPADLIVLGRRGRTGLGEMFLGSISNYLLHHAPCSVLVLQGRGTAAPAIEAQEQTPATTG
ncbi:universal stress protein [Gloeobacter kilaueensis]|uniref:Universal stress protein UspE n=1 Tax=Gloeobacter kilaueensis (strain ATCC BAA-2537 / CCAP 1431/1 / ULC 316 / JS1) TaxID=1183438 RepID=U5QI06_GLOK1|nr:universal stress protein [Gloeobacter kilaueensis]AGY58503.1 universal stress protein UspE [Gloeobacter kilaueensis JS1]